MRTPTRTVRKTVASRWVDYLQTQRVKVQNGETIDKTVLAETIKKFVQPAYEFCQEAGISFPVEESISRGDIQEMIEKAIAKVSHTNPQTSHNNQKIRQQSEEPKLRRGRPKGARNKMTKEHRLEAIA